MKALKTIAISTIIFVLSFNAFAQEAQKPSIEFFGFIRVDAYMDSYKGQDLGHDMFYLLPQYTMAEGVEINKESSAHVSAIASRLAARINGPDVFNAKLSGLMEFDFAGNLRSDATMFRIRQAYTLLTWEKSSLLMGQTWHPFFNGANAPTVAGLNTGAPFHAFNRSPMIRFNRSFNNLLLGLAAVTELQYSTPSVDYPVWMNTNNHAKRNGVLPELVLTLDWNNKGKLSAGAGAEFKQIKPRMIITNAAGESAKASQLHTSTGFVGFFKYKDSKFNILAKAYYGQNMSHLVMAGGYGVATYNPTTGEETYTNYNHYTALVSAVYGTEFQVGIFAGYGQNLGTSEKLHDFEGKSKSYGLFVPIQNMMRIAPHIAYNKGKLRFVLEMENTSASYGIGGLNLDNGLYSSVKQVTNNRVICTMTHYF